MFQRMVFVNPRPDAGFTRYYSISGRSVWMAAKGGLSLSPSGNPGRKRRACHRAAVPPRSGSLDAFESERHLGLNEWERSDLVKMAVRLSLFGVWGAVAPHVVFQNSG